MAMFRKSKHKDSKSSEEKMTLVEEFKQAKKNDLQLIAFFEKLYFKPELKPYWVAIHAAICENHAEENLDFFVDYLDLVAKPSLLKWNALYTNWIVLDTSGGFLAAPVTINITGRLKDLLTSLHKHIDTEDKKTFNLDSIILRSQEDDEQVYSGRTLVDMAAAEVLTLISSHDENLISGILAKPLSELTGGSKKKETKKKKEKM